MVLHLRQEKAFQISLTDVGDTRTWRTCHSQDTYHFNLGNREQKTVAYLYTGILIFFAFGGEGLTNEQGYLSSLCASPFRLHNTVVSLQLRLISFQSFFKNITSFEDSKASLTTPWTKEQVLNFSNWKIA